MKFEPDTAVNANVVTRHEPGRLWVGSQLVDHSMLIPWRGALADWAVSRFEDLDATHFDAIAMQQPEVVIFGSGYRLRFPKPAWLQSLMARRIGIETMDLGAACRTYNVLASEGRQVLLAVLIEGGPVGDAAIRGARPQSDSAGPGSVGE